MHPHSPSSSADPASLRPITRASGMAIACERVEGARSVSVSWRLPAGAAHDPEKNCGISSVVAELLLRGAGRMDSREQADAFDRAGAARSIEPSTRSMVVSATTTGDRLSETLALLVETVRRPRFDPDAIAPSKALALQSLASLADEPQERAAIEAKRRHLPAPINRSTLGQREGIEGIDHGAVTRWWGEHARPVGSVMGVAGDVDGAAFEAELAAMLGDWSGSAPDITPTGVPARGYAHETDDSNQVQIIVLQDAPPETRTDALLEKLAVGVLSGGMSGRLFTQVREVRGLCYAVSASYQGDAHTGVVSSYVGTTPERAQEALDVLFEELTRINAGDVTPEELARVKIGMRSRLVFSGESTGARSGAIARDLGVFGRVRPLPERADAIEAVGLDELNAYLRRRDPGRATIQTLGPTPLRPPTGV